MKFYTGWQWLLIDAATHYGLDKLTFEDRLSWTEAHFNELNSPSFIDQGKAKDRPLYRKAVQAIRSAQAGEPSGHMVGVDASASGIQIMSALTGCLSGCTATNLIDSSRQFDVYAEVTRRLNELLQLKGYRSTDNALVVPREDAKAALMRAYYGSKAHPKVVFGEDTPELDAFYAAAYEIAPGAWLLLKDLLDSWRPWALSHQWKLPDGFDAVCKVWVVREARIEVDELNHASFTHQFRENRGERKGLSNAANVIHSIDAWVLRSMHRRCNYDRRQAETAHGVLLQELMQRRRGVNGDPSGSCEHHDAMRYYLEQYRRSGVADIVVLPYLTSHTARMVSTAHLEALIGILQGMLQYQPFELVSVHDEFKAHANHVNWVRWQYKEILADLADSDLIGDLLRQIHRVSHHPPYPKGQAGVGQLIRQSNYALC